MEYSNGLNIQTIYQFVKKWVWALMISSLIGAILSIVVSEIFIEEQYRSEAQLIVNQPANQGTIQYSDIQVGTGLINTYRQIIKGHAVLQSVSDSLENEVTVGELNDAIVVTQTENAQTFDISVTLDSPDLAQNVAINTIEAFDSSLHEIYEGIDLNLFVISPPTFPVRAIKPSVFMRAIIGGLLGFILIFLVIIIREALDTSVKDDAFLLELGLVKLGELDRLTDNEFRENMINSGRRRTRNGRG